MSEIEEQISYEAGPELGPAPKPAPRRSLERSFGLIAGILFIGGSLAGIPSSLLIDPAPPASLYLVTVAGIAFGLGAMTIHWDRVSSVWTHVAMVAAIIQVAVCVALAGDPFVFYFVFIAIFAAYAFRDRNQIAVYLGLIGIALLVPILVIPDSTRASAAQALAAVPAIVLVAVMVVLLRERLEANRATTRRFAREALALSARIGRAPASLPPPIPARPVPAGLVAHPAWRRLALGASLVGVLITATGTMAATGVALPGPVEDSFASVGIEHDQDGVAAPDGGSAPDRQAPVHVDRNRNPAKPAASKPAHSAKSSKPRKAGHPKDAGGSRSIASASSSQPAAATPTPSAATPTSQAPTASQAPPAAPAAQEPHVAAPNPVAPITLPGSGSNPGANSGQGIGQQLGDQIDSIVGGLLGGGQRQPTDR